MNVKQEVCSIKQLHKAMMKCKKGVAWKDSVASFTNHGLVRCYQLKHALLDGTYRISKYIQFQVHEPKTRNIVSTRFVDRVFQRSLCDNYLTWEIQKDFIKDNYACQVGKGNDVARLALLAHIKKTNNRSQVTKMVHYYKELWEERDHATTKNFRTKSNRP